MDNNPHDEAPGHLHRGEPAALKAKVTLGHEAGYRAYGQMCRTGVCMPSQTARLELRIAPENKELIELAAKLKNVTITTFVTEVVLAQARAVVHGPSEPQPLTRPRPIGGWDFEVPLDFDEPLEDMADYL